jgi:hypothetical protein
VSFVGAFRGNFADNLYDPADNRDFSHPDGPGIVGG